MILLHPRRTAVTALVVLLFGSAIPAGAMAGGPAASGPAASGPAAGAGQPSASTSQPATATRARDYYGEELMRLTNLDRTSLGGTALAVDPALVAAVRDQPLTCPSDHRLVLHGRVKDMAARSYANHFVKGCMHTDGTTFLTFQDFLDAAGYSATYTWENVAFGNYPASTFTYKFGCPQDSTSGCKGSTPTVWATGYTEYMFMRQTQQRTHLLDPRYTRFGCAVWYLDSSDMNYYACIFAGGGRASVDTDGPAFSGQNGVGQVVAPGDSFTFKVTATDEVLNIAETSVTLDGTTLASTAYDRTGSTVQLSQTVSTADLASGAHVLVWRARDAGAIETALPIGFFVGSGTMTKPVVAFTKPTAALSYATTKPTISWSETLAISPPASRVVTAAWTAQVAPGVCGTAWTALPAVRATAATWKPTLAAGRCYRFSVSVTDAYGATATSDSGVLVVAAAPRLSVSRPAPLTLHSVRARSVYRVAWAVNPSGAPLSGQALTIFSARKPARGCAAVSSWRTGRTIAVGAGATSRTVTVGAAGTCYRFVVSATNAAGLRGTVTTGRLVTR